MRFVIYKSLPKTIVMLEWKILAAAFSALLVISMLLVGNSGVKDLFGGIVGKITDWMGGTPIDLPDLPGGKSGASQVQLTIYPRNFTLSPGKLNLTLGESYFESFSGDVLIDFDSQKISLKEKGSSFQVSSPIQPLTIQETKLAKLSYQGKFLLQSSQSNIANENGNLDIQGFSGSFSVQNSSIVLSGNVTKITGDGWAVG
jgi:hypothetical protein